MNILEVWTQSLCLSNIKSLINYYSSNLSQPSFVFFCFVFWGNRQHKIKNRTIRAWKSFQVWEHAEPRSGLRLLIDRWSLVGLPVTSTSARSWPASLTPPGCSWSAPRPSSAPTTESWSPGAYSSEHHVHPRHTSRSHVGCSAQERSRAPEGGERDPGPRRGRPLRAKVRQQTLMQRRVFRFCLSELNSASVFLLQRGRCVSGLRWDVTGRQRWRLQPSRCHQSGRRRWSSCSFLIFPFECIFCVYTRHAWIY